MLNSKDTMIIYKITNKVNGKIYIGQTKHTLERRWKEHKNLRAKNGYCLKAAIAKYGVDSFSVEVIGTYSTRDELNDAEQYFIEWHNCLAPNGYNLNSGGRSYEISEITRTRLSESHIGQVPSEYNREQSRKANSGRPTWNKGLTGYTNAGSFKPGQTPMCGFKVGGVAPNKGRKKHIIDGKVRYLRNG